MTQKTNRENLAKMIYFYKVAEDDSGKYCFLGLMINRGDCFKIADIILDAVKVCPHCIRGQVIINIHGQTEQCPTCEGEGYTIQVKEKI